MVLSSQMFGANHLVLFLIIPHYILIIYHDYFNNFN